MHGIQDTNTHVFPIQKKQDTLSFIDLAIALIDIGNGTGVTKLGSTFNNGWLTATVVSTAFALITGFSFYIQFCAFAKVQEGSFDSCCYKLFGKFGATIFCIVSIIPEVIVVYFYMTFCQSSIRAIILSFLPNVNTKYIHPLLIDSLILVFVFIPCTFSTTASSFKHISRIKFLIILFLIVAVVFLFTKKVQKVGFDPNKEIVISIPTIQSISACISTYATAYLIQPISFPSIGNLERSTWPRIVAMIFLVIGVQWFANELFGLLEYFTLYSRNKGDVFFNYFDTPFAVVANIALFVMMILSSVILTYPVRNVIIHVCVPNRKGRDKVMWAFLAIAIYIIFMYLTQAPSDLPVTILSFLLDVLAPFIMLTQPAIMYLYACGKSSIFLFVMSIILALVGIAFSVFFFAKFFIAL